ncbi:discoidin domain-containing protein [Leptolyngbya sp. NIES-2104]|uniref:discoidin domain-containing protein n=1 Tax=Leptolyngbya sp. NIES-2104 TaxID=1552121 RepID=UPI0006EC5327|nr:discoidin domain-containing protein [Leptolyngbya sp. NIES-2104]GAP99119.1 hypothetical protein NIES2104_56770 [Leptolyngbya sp. NIES-2104]
MSWSTIARIRIGQDWQFTPAIAPGLGYIRLTFGTAGIPVSVAQVNLDNGDLFDQREIVATAYAQIFEFENPAVFINRAIALRLPIPATSFDVQVELSSVFLSEGDGNGEIDFQPVLIGQTQILQAIDALDLDPGMSANITAILENQIAHVLKLNTLQTGQNQILQRLDQPVAIDPAILTALTTLLNGQSSQTVTLGQIQTKQSDHSATLQQIQASQSQILQAIAAPTPLAYNVITTAYTASQSSVFSGLIGTFANLSDNNGTTGAGTNSSTVEWIKATFPSAVTVRAVRLGGGNIPGWGGVSAYLNGKVLQYSTDDVNWLTALTVADVLDSGPNQFRLFALGQPITARFWRILSSGFLSTTELRFFN